MTGNALVFNYSCSAGIKATQISWNVFVDFDINEISIKSLYKSKWLCERDVVTYIELHAWEAWPGRLGTCFTACCLPIRVHKQGKEINKSRSLSRISQQLKIVATLSCRSANRALETFRRRGNRSLEFCTKVWNLPSIILKSFFNSRGALERFFFFFVACSGTIWSKSLSHSLRLFLGCFAT